jgi:hypothetical protein
VVGVLEGSDGAGLDTVVLVKGESFLANFAVIFVGRFALGALGVGAGLALTIIVLEVSGRAGADAHVVVDNISLLASVADTLVRSALETLGVGTGDAGGNGEKSSEESGAAFFDTGELSGEGERRLAFDALFGDGSGAFSALRIDASYADFVVD